MDKVGYRDLTGFSFEGLYKHFIPGDWEKQEGKEKSDGKKKLIKDMHTGLYYEDDPDIRIKSLALFIFNPLIHIPILIFNILYRIIRVILFVPLWSYPKKLSAKDRWTAWGVDILRIALTPIAFIGLQFSAIYGVIDPKNGRKYTVAIQNLIYGETVFPICFKNVRSNQLNHSKYYGSLQKMPFIVLFLIYSFIIGILSCKSINDIREKIKEECKDIMMIRRGLFSHVIKKKEIFEFFYHLKMNKDKTFIDNSPTSVISKGRGKISFLKSYGFSVKVFEKMNEKYGDLTPEELKERIENDKHNVYNGSDFEKIWFPFFFA